MDDKNPKNDGEIKGVKDIPKSRKKYELNNPNWTVRMPKKWHDDYEIYVKERGLSRREFMGVVLEKIKLDNQQIRVQHYNEGFGEGRKQGYQDGYAEGVKIGYNNGLEEGFEKGKKFGFDQGAIDCSIWYYCSICGEPIYIKPDSEEHEMIIDFIDSQGWAHIDCANRLFYW